MTVKELMSTNICFVKADAFVIDAINLMKQYNIGLVPVCDEVGEILGLITDRDIILRGLSGDTKDLHNLSVQEVMTKEIISITPEMDIHHAAMLLSQHKIRRLPVLQGGRLIGILSISDLAKKRVYLAEVGDILGAIATKENMQKTSKGPT